MPLDTTQLKINNNRRRLERIDRDIEQMKEALNALQRKRQQIDQKLSQELEKQIEVAKERAKSELKGDRGPQGPQGPPGPQGEKGEPGEGPEVEDITNALLDNDTFLEETRGPQGPKGEDGQDGSPDDGKDIINKINDAPRGNKIKQEYLEFPEDRKGPRTTQVLSGGGGDITTFSTEDGTISGTVDGSNKDFTLSSDLKNPVVFADGVRQTETLDYTKSGKDITFTDAAPRQVVTVDGQIK